MSKKSGAVWAGRNDIESEGHVSLIERPLSLSCSPTLTLLYVIGIEEAQAIVESYRPRFKVRYATRSEMEVWAW